MRCALRMHRWAGQLTVFLIATRELLGFEQRRKAGAAGQRVIYPAGINSSFSQQGIRPPTWVRPAQVQDGIMHSRWKSTQWSGNGAAYVRAEADAPLMETTAPPCVHRPD